jgi:hypothetical protein
MKNTNKLKKIKRELADPKMLLSLLMSNQFEDIFQNIVCSQKLSLIAQTIKVREIWVGGFRNSISKNLIESVFSKIGEIDQLNYYPKKYNQSFCFIKFIETVHAEESKNMIEIIKNQFNSNIKIAMSDFLKR